MELTKQKKVKLKNLLVALSSEKERSILLQLDTTKEVGSVKQSVEDLKKSLPSKQIEQEVGVIKNKLSRLEKIGFEGVNQLLGDIKEILARPATPPQDLSGFFKDFPTLLAQIVGSTQRTSELMTNLKWNASMGVRNNSGSPINPSIDAFNIGDYDDIVLAYTGSNLTSVTYKQGGATRAVLTLTYSGSNLIEVSRTT